MKRRGFIGIAAILAAGSTGFIGWKHHVESSAEAQQSDLVLLFDKIICRHEVNRKIFTEIYTRDDSLYVLNALLNNKISSNETPSPNKEYAIFFDAKPNLTANDISAIANNLSLAILNKEIVYTVAYSPSRDLDKSSDNSKVARKAKDSIRDLEHKLNPSSKPSPARFTPDYFEIYATDGDINAFRATAAKLLEAEKAKNPPQNSR